MIRNGVVDVEVDALMTADESQTIYILPPDFLLIAFQIICTLPAFLLVFAKNSLQLIRFTYLFKYEALVFWLQSHCSIDK